MINRLLWHLPAFVQDLIHWLTGYRLTMIRHYDQFGPYGYTYVWSKRKA